jgi:hypothetical protein
MFKRNNFRGLAIVASLVLAQPLVLQSAHAVDNMETSGDIDLTSVRAKIKAQDYKAALAELRDLAEDNQNADVCSRTTRLRANILASSSSRQATWTKRRNSLPC